MNTADLLAEPELSITSVSERSLRSILVIRFRFMGDLVLIAALLQNLRRHYPNSRISILSDTANTPLLSLVEGVEVIPFPNDRRVRHNPFLRIKSWIRVASALRARKFDLVIDCMDTRSSAIMTALVGAPLRMGYRPSQRRQHRWLERIYNVPAAPFGPGGSHFLDRFLSPLAALGRTIEVSSPRITAPPDARETIKQRFAEFGLEHKRFIVIHPGARIARRRWLPENFASLADKLSEQFGLPVILIGGPDERDLVAEVRAAARSQPLDFAGMLSIGELVALLEECRLYIGNDTGPMHLAAAAGAQVVALFGVQSPVQWGPVGSGHTVLRPSMPCPCPWPEICIPLDTNGTLCVRRLTVDEVITAVEATLAEREAMSSKAPK